MKLVEEEVVDQIGTLYILAPQIILVDQELLLLILLKLGEPRVECGQASDDLQHERIVAGIALDLPLVPIAEV